MSDLIKHLEQQAKLDNEADRLARGDKGQPATMVSIGDGALKAFNRIIDGYEGKDGTPQPEPFPSSPDREGMNLDLAINKYKNSEKYIPLSATGLSDACIRGIDAYGKGKEVCESPLERYLLPWLIFFDWHPFHDGPVPVVLPTGDDPQQTKSSLLIVPQLAFGRYRLDFAVVARSASKSIIIGVECDGAAYHDARLDRQRDAYFAAFRIPTVRAASAEIRNQPEKVVERVFRLVEAWGGLK